MEAKIYVTPENDPRDYVGYDLFGYPFNKKYPLNKEKYGQAFEGYSCKALGVLLYDFLNSPRKSKISSRSNTLIL